MKRTDVDKNIFHKLDSDVIRFSRVGKVMIMGDLNAHINKKEHDYIANESADNLDDFVPNNYSIDNIHRRRNTFMPQTTNEYGKIILDLCISSQLRILNGRTLGDTRGKATFHGFNGSSIDDYCICSATLLDDVYNFCVRDFDVTQSDHALILVNIQSYVCHHDTDNLREAPKSIIWDKVKMESFRHNLSYVCKNALSQELVGILNNSILSEQERVDLTVDKLTSLMNSAALTVHKQNSKNKRIKRKRKQVWYDNDCSIKYKHIKFLSRQLENNSWDNHLRSKLFYEHKLYKRLVRKKHRAFKNKLLSNLMENEKKNPKDFWNTVNTLLKTNKGDASQDISSDIWIEHFKSLLNIDYSGNFPRNDSINCSGLNNSILNASITANEIQKSINSLKNGKSCGLDGISNEMLKISTQFFMQEYVDLFNFILKSGFYPDVWRDNIIKPIYKGGGTLDPSNYRGIAVSSCFGKLFSRLLFNRLDKYIEENELIYPEQIGFRKKFRTSDHILTLKTLIDKAFKSKNYLFSCFVDFSKAFDMVNRAALLHKLELYNISGPFLNIIKDMYQSVRCSVKIGNSLSPSFSTKSGVKQGCILSPTLFSLFINDLNRNFDEKCDQVLIGERLLSCLLYADDIVLLSKSAEGLQNALNCLSEFCLRWNLKVNINKTKVIIFNKSGKILKGFSFTFDDEIVEVVNEYKYLGIIFKPSGKILKGACLGENVDVDL